MALFLILVLVFLLGIALGLLAQNVHIHRLATRISALEKSHWESTTSLAQTPSRPLASLRVAVSIRQDHALSPFETLLGEALAQEGAILVGVGEDVRVVGTLKGNGYADVYFDADLTAETGGQVILRMREWPPHGDRPENLAREIVARLAAEMEKRERQNALRELGL